MIRDFAFEASHSQGLPDEASIVDEIVAPLNRRIKFDKVAVFRKLFSGELLLQLQMFKRGSKTAKKGQTTEEASQNEGRYGVCH